MGTRKFAAELFFVLDHLEPAHIGLQHVGHGDRTVLLLIGLHHGDQRAAHRRAGAVQRMHEAWLAVAPTIAASIRRAWKSPHTEQLEISR